SDSVSVIETASDTVVGAIAVGHAPASTASTVDGTKLYVGLADGLVSVVDLALGTTVNTLTLGAPAAGYSVDGLVVSPDGARAYGVGGSLFVLDPATDAILSSTYAGNNPTALALPSDGSRAYVLDAFGYGDFSFYGAAAVVDAPSATVTSSLLTWGVPMEISL